MMQKVQEFIFAVYCFGFSLLFHLSLAVQRFLLRQEGVFSIAYTKLKECFGFGGGERVLVSFV